MKPEHTHRPHITDPGTHMLDEHGRELLDGTPIDPPIGYVKVPSMVEIIRQQVRLHLSQAAEEHGLESFDEAEDFDVDDDIPDPQTPYEAVFDPPPPPPSLKKKSGGEGAAEAPSDAKGPKAPSDAPSKDSGPKSDPPPQ